MPSVSQSEIRTFLDCHRKHFISYVEKLQPKRTPFAFLQGRVFHEGLAAYYSGEVDEEVLAKANALVPVEEKVSMDDEVSSSEEWERGDYLAARWRGVLRAYAEQYPRDEFVEVPEIERRHKVDYLNRTEGDPWKLSGRFDGIVMDDQARFWLLEHKSASSDALSALSNLQLDFQIGFYLLMCDLLAKRGRISKVAGVLYNVVVKPTIRAKLVWDCRVKDADGVIRHEVVEGKPTLKWLNEGGFTLMSQEQRRQMPSEYEQRVFDEMTANAPSYFIRHTVLRSDVRRDVFHDDLSRILHALGSGEHRYPNYAHCQYCAFRRLCSANPNDRPDVVAEFYEPKRWN